MPERAAATLHVEVAAFLPALVSVDKQSANQSKRSLIIWEDPF
jgi:hypothetical protein